MKKKSKKKNTCPICSKNLHLDTYYTMKIGILDSSDDDKLIGWICPFCKSEFDNKDNIMYIYGVNFEGGKA